MVDLYPFRQSLYGCQYLRLSKTFLFSFLRIDQSSFHHSGNVLLLYSVGHTDSKCVFKAFSKSQIFDSNSSVTIGSTGKFSFDNIAKLTTEKCKHYDNGLSTFLTECLKICTVLYWRIIINLYPKFLCTILLLKAYLAIITLKVTLKHRPLESYFCPILHKGVSSRHTVNGLNMGCSKGPIRKS